MSAVLIAMVRFYQNAISPLFLPRCRYFPSCSAYAVDALQIHGAMRGSWLAARRLGRCHPWTPGGVDHVPPRRDTTNDRTKRRSTDRTGTAGDVPSTTMTSGAGVATASGTE